MKKHKKKALPALLILLCTLLAVIPAVAIENISKEFRGIPWGAAAPSEDSADSGEWGLVVLGSADSVTLCRRAEQVSVGEVKITSPIEYIFHDRLGFSCVIIPFNEQEKYDLLLRICVGNWGEPSSIQKGKNSESGGAAISNLWIDRIILKMLNYNTDIPNGGVSVVCYQRFCTN